MPDYKKNAPNGWCGDPTRGAAMGRSSVHMAPRGYAGKLALRQVRLNDGGYDSNDTYFGLSDWGNRLYWCANDDHTIDYMLRARDREDAREQVLDQYPDAKVRR